MTAQNIHGYLFMNFKGNECALTFGISLVSFASRVQWRMTLSRPLPFFADHKAPHGSSESKQWKQKKSFIDHIAIFPDHFVAHLMCLFVFRWRKSILFIIQMISLSLICRKSSPHKYRPPLRISQVPDFRRHIKAALFCKLKVCAVYTSNASAKFHSACMQTFQTE